MEQRKLNSDFTFDSESRTVEGMAVVFDSPSEEQLFAWGFREWIEPAPTPTELLERAKMQKIAEIEAYDNSGEVNGFDIVVGGQTMAAWLTPDNRSDYKNSLDSAELLGMTEVHPVLMVLH